MKLACEVVQDLLPLLEDNVCTEQSRADVEEHLKQCENCRKLAEESLSLSPPVLAPEPSAEDKAVVKSFRKVRRRRLLLSLLAVLLVIPVALLCWAVAAGINFENLDQVMTASAYTNALASGDFEKAAGFLDYIEVYNDMRRFQQKSLDGGAELTEVRIGNEVWMAEANFAEDCLTDTSDPLQTWFQLIRDGRDGVLFPEAVWDELVRTYPEGLTKDSDGVDLFYGKYWHRYESDWGVFMVDDQLWLHRYDDSLTRLIYDGDLLLFPVALYQDEKQQLDEYARNEYEIFLGIFGHLVDKNLAEFTEYEKGEYAEDLNDLALQGLSIKNRGFQSVYLTLDGRSIVVYAVELSWNKSSGVVYLDIECRDGSIISVNAHDSIDAYWANLFASAVRMRHHMEYE